MRGDSTFQTVVTDLVGDSSPQLGGNLDTNGNNIHFADNNSARFGTGQDFDVYHSGSHGFIDNNTGDLNIESSNVYIKANNTENAVSCIANGAVELYHNNTKRLETSSTGVNLPAGVLTVNGPSGTSYTLDVLPLVSTPYGLRVKQPASVSNGYPLLAVSENGGATLFRVLSGTGVAETRTMQPVTNLSLIHI